MERLETLYEDDAMDETERGIFRQLRDRGLESLSAKQRYRFEYSMTPQCVERCNFQGCTNPTYPGKTYCGMHGIEYGED